MANDELGKASPEQIARLLRLSKHLDLGEKPKNLLKESLLLRKESPLGQCSNPPNDHGLVQRIHRLIEAGSDFGEVKPLAMELFRLQPDAKTASWLIELSFLHGLTSEVTHLMKFFVRSVEDFYESIQPQLRKHLILQLWLEKSDGVLQLFLNQTRPGSLNIEKLYVFFALLQQDNPSETFMFYKNHERAIRTAVLEYGEKLRISTGELLVAMAKTAFALDYESEAASYIEGVSKEDAAFSEAMELFLKIDVDRDGKGQCAYGRELVNEPTWMGRVKLFYKFLAEARRVGNLRSKSRPALNELLANPLKWVPELPEAWAAMSQMLVNNRDLSRMFPNIFQIFKDHSMVFQSKLLDIALWQPLIDLKIEDQVWDRLWQGIARIHMFVSKEGCTEEYLWEGFEVIRGTEELKFFESFLSWEQLSRRAKSFIAWSPEIPEHRRKMLLRQLAIATDDRNLVISDLEEYLRESESPPYKILKKLHQKVRHLNQDHLELTILRKKSSLSHFLNEDLGRMFSLATTWKQYDLAWRVASVLKSRGVLHDKVEHPWAISGEKRDQFVTQPPGLKMIKTVTGDLALKEQKLVNAILQVGPMIPDLVAILDPGVRQIKPRPDGVRSLESLVSQQLDRVTWLARSKKNYLYSFEGPLVEGLRIPKFLTLVPQNGWSLMMVKLVERLGIDSWGWSLKRLSHYLDDAIPRPVMGQTSGHPGKIGRWLRRLSPMARSAWYDLPGILPKISEERGLDIQAILVFRLALILNQNSYQALASLRAMRAPVHMVWQFENWLLSDQYSKIRDHYGLDQRVIIPDSVKRLPSIVGGFKPV